jgi:hypothetical protein
VLRPGAAGADALAELLRFFWLRPETTRPLAAAAPRGRVRPCPAAPPHAPARRARAGRCGAGRRGARGDGAESPRPTPAECGSTLARGAQARARGGRGPQVLVDLDRVVLRLRYFEQMASAEGGAGGSEAGPNTVFFDHRSGAMLPAVPGALDALCAAEVTPAHAAVTRVGAAPAPEPAEQPAEEPAEDGGGAEGWVREGGEAPGDGAGRAEGLQAAQSLRDSPARDGTRAPPALAPSVTL